jgi:nitrilase
MQFQEIRETCINKKSDSHMTTNNEILKIGLAQIAPVWLDRDKTSEKIIQYIEKAGKENCDLVVFGEALLPGYPFWLDPTGGAKWNDPLQKVIFAHYARQSVYIEDGGLNAICDSVAKNQTATYLGIIERPANRGHSLYCSLVFIDKKGKIQSVHRKLMPTHDERLVWSIGDGNGLKCHKMGSFTLGGLNCWENWMPLPRTALYSQGEDVHIAVWPGSVRNTEDITRFIARESRSWVISASALMRKENIPTDLPFYNEIIHLMPDEMTDGGSCVAGPDAEWLLPPQVNTEDLFTVEIEHEIIRMERQNFNASGHYSRPDVLSLNLNSKRQQTLDIND